MRALLAAAYDRVKRGCIEPEDEDTPDITSFRGQNNNTTTQKC